MFLLYVIVPWPCRRNMGYSMQKCLCFLVLCNAMDCTLFRHQAAAAAADLGFSAQLEKTLVDVDDSSKTPLLSCPNCLYKTERAGAGSAEAGDGSDGIRLEAIKHQILMKLGLKDKPNVTHHLPKAVIMETLFRAEENRGFLGDAESHEDDVHTTSTRANYQDQQDFDDFYGRTSEIITFAEQGQAVNNNRLLEFRMSREQDNAAGQDFRVRAATLWLRVDLRAHHGHGAHRHAHAHCVPTIWVFSVSEQMGEEVTWLRNEDFDKMTELSATQSLDLSELGWQKFDLTSTVRSWYSSSTSSSAKLRLLIDCSGCCKPVQVHTVTGGDQNPNRPFLVVHTDPSTTKRVRRRALDCAGAVKNQCCKQRFYVSFKELGWDDWVIAPNGYYANYCRGDCGSHRTPDTFLNYYTHVIEEIRKKHHLIGMQPCCAPLKFSSMSLIYFGPDSNIIKRDLPKMVVDECGCP